MTIQIKQDFDYQNDGYWLWSVSIDGEPEELDAVEFVQYTLHSSYPQPVREIKERNSKFKLTEKASEGFTIYAIITYKNGGELLLQHDLALAKISIKSGWRQRDDKTRDWELSVEGDGDELDKIKSVSYQSPYFKRQTSNRRSHFKIKGENSGVIPVMVDVYFSDGRFFRFEETLQPPETKDEEKLKAIAEIAEKLFTPPSPEKIAEPGAPTASAGLETKDKKKPEEIADITDQPFTSPSPESTATEATPAAETRKTPAEPSAEVQYASTIPPTLMSRITLNVQSTVAELLTYIRRPASPGASSEVAYDITRVLENPLYPSSIEQLKQYIMALKGFHNFALARKLLDVVLHDQDSKWLKQKEWIKQQLALCTYKDEELYPKYRLETALELLESIGLRNSNNIDAETLALGGAVYKRLWEFDGQLDNLYESLAFYRAAWERNPRQDMGYGGVNAAYLLDMLAARAEGLEKSSGLTSREAPKLRREAEEIRKNIRSLLLDQLDNPGFMGQYWFLVTVGEACFGLGEYSEAAKWLDRARKVEAKEWELQTTFRQWVGIARQQGIEVPPENHNPKQWHEAWKTLQHLLGDETAEALVCYRGKVGLALSGGGFRASFFHLGVMARLAEVDALRGVDVLSTVSGGSILGVQYYLEVQNLLQDPSKKLSRDDYLDLIEKLQKDFLQGVQTNIRMRAFNNFADNVRMLFSKSYSRSHKLGELYEKYLYAKVADGKGGRQRLMPDLLVKPAHGKFQGDSFKPNFHNWRRRAKVPILLLNTTSLNSGHNWFFTANWMGEPPGLISEEIDSNERYRRLYYYQAPEHLKNFRLGHAAAASSCVPGLFEPLMLDKLYYDRTVKLVDGGVHDNQGVQGLLDEACTLILCSDASGQMGNVENPAEDPGSVLLRTVSVLQDRVREAEYQDLQARLDSRALHGLFFIHTQKDLASKPLDWLNCQDPSSNKAEADSNLTSYGIAKDLQTKIAAIRTDLDSFTEVEACALMASGYLMAEQQLKDLDEQHKKDGKPGSWGDFDIYASQQKDWDFLKLKTLLAEQPGEQASGQRKDLALQLQVGSALFFKAWQLIPWLKISAFATAVLVALVLFKLMVSQWQNTFFAISLGELILALLGVLAALFLPAMRWLNPKKEVSSIVIRVSIMLTGYCLAKLHLAIFDSLFLARGKLERLLNLGNK